MNSLVKLATAKSSIDVEGVDINIHRMDLQKAIFSICTRKPQIDDGLQDGVRLRRVVVAKVDIMHRSGNILEIISFWCFVL